MGTGASCTKVPPGRGPWFLTLKCGNGSLVWTRFHNSQSQPFCHSGLHIRHHWSSISVMARRPQQQSNTNTIPIVTFCVLKLSKTSRPFSVNQYQVMCSYILKYIVLIENLRYHEICKQLSLER